MTRIGPHVQQVERVRAAVDRGEVLRYLGYPIGVEPQPRILAEIDKWVREAGRRSAPRAAYRVLSVVEFHPRRLRLATPHGEIEFRGAVGEFLGASECVAAFIATAGLNVERLASELIQGGDHLAAMVVNAVGAERAEAAEAVVIEQLLEQARLCGFAPTLPYSPGYCGMALAEQRTLFSLFGGHDVGVTLSETCLMQPLKSVSGLIGLGPTEKVQAFGSPCDRCELYNCAMRR